MHVVHDDGTEQEIQAALDNLIQGRTTIAIAHRLSTLRRADRLVVLERGRPALAHFHPARLRGDLAVIPELVPHCATYDEMVRLALNVVRRRALARTGDRVIVTAGVPFDVPGTTNMMKVETV